MAKRVLLVGQISVRIAFEPRDLWLGVFVGKPEFQAKVRSGLVQNTWTGEVRLAPSEYWTERRIYICLIPMLPVILVWRSDRRGNLHRAERPVDVSVELQSGDPV